MSNLLFRHASLAMRAGARSAVRVSMPQAAVAAPVVRVQVRSMGIIGDTLNKFAANRVESTKGALFVSNESLLA